MRILITGGTGLIGTRLSNELARRGEEVYILTRSPEKYRPKDNLHYVQWDGQQVPTQEVGQADYVINLAGAGIADHRWTRAYKNLILSSRINTTTACVNYIKALENKPKAFLSASAVGYYGTHREKPVTEEAGPGKDFLSKTCVKWEKSAEGTGVRTVLLRTGIVLAEEGGAFPKLLTPFKFYAGSYLGNGKQGFPWIHIEDVLGLYLFAMENETIEGPLNVAAPEMLSNKAFAKVLGNVVNIPVMGGLPSLVVKGLMGERAIILLEGQLVEPRKALDNGYAFQYPTAKGAIRDILDKSPAEESNEEAVSAAN